MPESGAAGPDVSTLKQKLTPSQLLHTLAVADTSTHESKNDIIELITMADHSHQTRSSVPMDSPLFAASPHQVSFLNYEPFVETSAQLLLRNVDSVPRRVRVLPPDSPFFRIGPPTDPRGEALVDSRIAPGMAVAFTVYFRPQERQNYAYNLVVVTEREKFLVPLRARGPRPFLSFPDSLAFESAPVKSAAARTFVVRNIGDAPAEVELHSDLPFTASPRTMAVPVGGAEQVTVTFNPSQARFYQGELAVSYVGGTTAYVQLSGEGHDVDVGLDAGLVALDATYIGLTSATTVRLLNRSDMPVRFSWKSLAVAAQEQTDRANLLEQLTAMHEAERSALLEEAGPDLAMAAAIEPRAAAAATAGGAGLPLTDSMALSGPALSLRAQLSALDRKYRNFERQVQEDPLLFTDGAFKLEPAEGVVWSHSVQEFTVSFTPPTAADYAITAFLEVTGRERRLPLELRGTGIGPKAMFAYDVIDVGDVYVTSTHRYELQLLNRGDIAANWRVQPPAAGGARFVFDPPAGTLPVGSSQAIGVTFTPDVLGEFSEVFEVALEGSLDVLRVHFRGYVIGPTFHADVPAIEFGRVPFEFLSASGFCIHNTSEVPFTFRLRVPQDGTLLGKEFDITPAEVRIAPGESQEVRVDFVPTTVKDYDYHVAIDVDDVGEDLLCLPLTAQCVVPTVLATKPAMDFGTAFLRYPYTQQLVLTNTGDQPARYEVQPQDPHHSFAAVFRCTHSTGTVPAQGETTIDVTFKAQKRGPLSVPMRVAIAGASSPPLLIELRGMGSGPVIRAEPSTLAWGRIQCLTPSPRPLALRNDSLIPASIQLFIKGARPKFALEVAEEVLSPGATTTVDVTATLDDTTAHKDELHVVVAEGEPVVVPLEAMGGGTTMHCDMDLTKLDFGHAWTNLPVTRTFVLENKGRRTQTLTWSNFTARERAQAAKRAARLGQASGAPPAPTVFRVDPPSAVVKPRTAVAFTVKGQSAKAGLAEETLECSTQVADERGSAVIFSCATSAQFQNPLLKIQPSSLQFEFVQQPHEVPAGSAPRAATLQTQTLQLRNVSRLPLDVSMALGEPFALVPSSLRIPPGEAREVAVEFDPGYRLDRQSHSVDTTLLVSFHKHPRQEKVPVSANIHFPNLELAADHLDFGTILNDTVKSMTLRMTNTSACDLHLSWAFVEDAEAAAAACAAADKEYIPVNQVFDIVPLRARIAPGESSVAEFVFTGHPRRTFAATAVATVEGGPEYEVRLAGSADSLAYRLDRATLDFGRVLFDRLEEREFFIHNTGQVPYGFQAEVEQEQRPGAIAVVPSHGTVAAGSKLRVAVRLRPGVPGTVKEALRVQVAHFDPVLFPVTAEAVFACVSVGLPRLVDGAWARACDDAVALLEQRATALHVPGSEEEEQAGFGGSAAPGHLESRPSTAASDSLSLLGTSALHKSLASRAGVDDAHGVSVASLGWHDGVSLLLNPDAMRKAYMAAAAELAAGGVAPGAAQLPALTESATAVQQRRARFANTRRAARAALSLDVEAEALRLVYAQFLEALYAAAAKRAAAALGPSDSELSRPLSRLSVRSSAARGRGVIAGGNAAAEDALVNAVASQGFRVLRPADASRPGTRRRPAAERFVASTYRVDLGTVIPGTTKRISFSVMNTGGSPVSMEADAADAAALGITVEPSRVQRLPELSSATITVTFNAQPKRFALLGQAERGAPGGAAMPLGTHEVIVPVAVSNGPAIQFAISVTVAYPHVEVVSGNTLDFKAVPCGCAGVYELLLRNPSPVPAHWRMAAPIGPPISTADAEFFTFAPSAGVLPPGATTCVQASFKPSAARKHSVNIPLRVENTPIVQSLALRGQGAVPDLQVHPPALSLGPVLPRAEPVRATITLHNSGARDLTVAALKHDPGLAAEDKLLNALAQFDAKAIARLHERAWAPLNGVQLLPTPAESEVHGVALGLRAAYNTLLAQGLLAAAPAAPAELQSPSDSQAVGELDDGATHESKASESRAATPAAASVTSSRSKGAGKAASEPAGPSQPSAVELAVQRAMQWLSPLPDIACAPSAPQRFGSGVNVLVAGPPGSSADWLACQVAGALGLPRLTVDEAVAWARRGLGGEALRLRVEAAVSQAALATPTEAAAVDAKAKPKAKGKAAAPPSAPALELPAEDAAHADGVPAVFTAPTPLPESTLTCVLQARLLAADAGSGAVIAGVTGLYCPGIPATARAIARACPAASLYSVLLSASAEQLLQDASAQQLAAAAEQLPLAEPVADSKHDESGDEVSASDVRALASEPPAASAEELRVQVAALKHVLGAGVDAVAEPAKGKKGKKDAAGEPGAEAVASRAQQLTQWYSAWIELCSELDSEIARVLSSPPLPREDGEELEGKHAEEPAAGQAAATDETPDGLNGVQAAVDMAAALQHALATSSHVITAGLPVSSAVLADTLRGLPDVPVFHPESSWGTPVLHPTPRAHKPRGPVVCALLPEAPLPARAKLNQCDSLFKFVAPEPEQPVDEHASRPESKAGSERDVPAEPAAPLGVQLAAALAAARAAPAELDVHARWHVPAGQSKQVHLSFVAPETGKFDTQVQFVVLGAGRGPGVSPGPAGTVAITAVAAVPDVARDARAMFMRRGKPRGNDYLMPVPAQSPLAEQLAAAKLLAAFARRFNVQAGEFAFGPVLAGRAMPDVQLAPEQVRKQHKDCLRITNTGLYPVHLTLGWTGEDQFKAAVPGGSDPREEAAAAENPESGARGKGGKPAKGGKGAAGSGAATPAEPAAPVSSVFAALPAELEPIAVGDTLEIDLWAAPSKPGLWSNSLVLRIADNPEPVLVPLTVLGVLPHLALRGDAWWTPAPQAQSSSAPSSAKGGNRKPPVRPASTKPGVDAAPEAAAPAPAVPGVIDFGRRLLGSHDTREFTVANPSCVAVRWVIPAPFIAALPPGVLVSPTSGQLAPGAQALMTVELATSAVDPAGPLPAFGLHEAPAALPIVYTDCSRDLPAPVLAAGAPAEDAPGQSSALDQLGPLAAPAVEASMAQLVSAHHLALPSSLQGALASGPSTARAGKKPGSKPASRPASAVLELAGASAEPGADGVACTLPRVYVCPLLLGGEVYQVKSRIDWGAATGASSAAASPRGSGVLDAVAGVLSYGTVKVGDAETRCVKLHNDGKYAVHWAVDIPEHSAARSVLSAEPSSGDIAPGSSVDVRIKFQSTGKEVSLARCNDASIVICEDQAGAETERVQLEVSAAAVYSRCRFAPSRGLNFGAVRDGTSKVASMEICNTGSFAFSYQLMALGSEEDRQWCAAAAASAVGAPDAAAARAGSAPGKPKAKPKGKDASGSADDEVLLGADGATPFKAWPASGTVLPGQQAAIQVEYTSVGAAVHSAGMRVAVAGFDVAGTGADALQYTVAAESCVPSIITEDWGTLFEEQLHVPSLLDMPVPAGAPAARVSDALTPAAFALAERALSFGYVLPRSADAKDVPSGPAQGSVQRVRISNPAKVPAEVQLDVVGIGKAAECPALQSVLPTADEVAAAAGTDVAFAVHPATVLVPPHEYRYVDVSFRPQSLGLHRGVLRGTVVGGDSELSVFVQGEGAMPTVAVVLPLDRDESGSVLLDFGRLAEQRDKTLALTLRNVGPVPAVANLQLPRHPLFELLASDSTLCLAPGEAVEVPVRCHPAAGVASRLAAGGAVDTLLQVQVSNNPFAAETVCLKCTVLDLDVALAGLPAPDEAVRAALAQDALEQWLCGASSPPASARAGTPSDKSRGAKGGKGKAGSKSKAEPAAAADPELAHAEELVLPALALPGLQDAHDGASAATVLAKGEARLLPVQNRGQHAVLLRATAPAQVQVEPTEVMLLPGGCVDLSVRMAASKPAVLRKAPLKLAWSRIEAVPADMPLADPGKGVVWYPGAVLAEEMAPADVPEPLPSGWQVREHSGGSDLVLLEQPLARPELAFLPGTPATTPPSSSQSASRSKAKGSKAKGSKAKAAAPEPAASAPDEPEHGQLLVAVSGIADVPRIVTDQTQLSFAATNMFGTRNHVVTVSNQSALPLAAQWRVRDTTPDVPEELFVDCPFALEPELVDLRPGASVTTTAKFAPLEVASWSAVASLRCPLLDGAVRAATEHASPLQQAASAPASLQLAGRAQRPVVHLALPACDYLSRRPAHLPGVDGKLGPLDASVKVLEFVSLGTGVRNTARFGLLNPTAQPYKFVWEKVHAPAAPSAQAGGAPGAGSPRGAPGSGARPSAASLAAAFNCATPQGTAMPGVQFDVQFEYTPAVVDVAEAWYRLYIPEHGLSQLLLLTGSVKEPRVQVLSSVLNFKQAMVGSRTAKELELRNDEVLPFAFEVLGTRPLRVRRGAQGRPAARSTAAATGELPQDGPPVGVVVGAPLRVMPSSGVIPAGSTAKLTVEFLPDEESAFNTVLAIAVKKKPTPLSVNVKGEGYAIHDTLRLEQPHREPAVLRPGASASLDYGRIQVGDVAARTVVLSNDGDFAFDFDWTVQGTARGGIAGGMSANNVFAATGVGLLRGGAASAAALKSVVVEPASGRLARGEQAVCRLQFKPSAAVDIAGLLAQVRVAGTRTYSIALAGSGMLPDVQFSTTKLEFGRCFVPSRPGAPPVPVQLPVHVKNMQPHDSVSLECVLGDAPGASALSVRPASVSIPPGGSTQLLFEFVPRAEGPLACPVHVEIDGRHSVALQARGEGVSAVLGLANPGQKRLHLGALRVGQRTERRVELVNQSSRRATVALVDPEAVHSAPDDLAGATSLQRLADEFGISVSPAQLAVPPGGVAAFSVSFAPRARAAPFQAELAAAVLPDALPGRGIPASMLDPRPLLTLSGACQDMAMQLGADTVSFGAVCMGSASTRTLQLLNVGDIGASWAWDARTLPPEFTVRPMSGFLAPATDASVEIRFEPSAVRAAVRVPAAVCHVEGGPTLRVELLAECVPRPSQAEQTLTFACPVRSSCVQSITLPVNRSSRPITLAPTLDHPYWSVPAAVEVPAGASAELPVTFKPLTMTAAGAADAAAAAAAAAAGSRPGSPKSKAKAGKGGSAKAGPAAAAPAESPLGPLEMPDDGRERPAMHEGSVFIAMPDGTGVLYGLQGTASVPSLAGTLEFRGAAKSPIAISIPVKNWASEPLRLAVTWLGLGATDAAAMRGPTVVDVPALGSREYKASLVAFTSGQRALRAVFTAVDSGEFLAYDVLVDVQKAGLQADLSLRAVVRQTARAVVRLNNPLASAGVPIHWEAPRCDSPDVRVRELADVTGQVEGAFEVQYKPLLPVDSGTATLVLHSPELGEFQYELHLTALAAGPEPAMRFAAALGSSHVQSYRLRALHTEPTTFTARLVGPDAGHFSVPESVAVPAAGDAEHDVPCAITYEPTAVGTSKCTLELSSSAGGKYEVPLTGTATTAKPSGPVLVPPAGVTLTFKNIFHEPTKYAVAADSRGFLVEPSVLELDGKSAGTIQVLPAEGHDDTAASARLGKVIVYAQGHDNVPPWTTYVRRVTAEQAEAAAAAGPVPGLTTAATSSPTARSGRKKK